MNRGSRARVTSPQLVGRDDDVRALVECGTSLVSQAPAVALVSGRAGMGKSRLVAEATTLLRAEGVTVLAGAGVPFGPDGPPALRATCRRTRPSPPRERARPPGTDRSLGCRQDTVV
jgi:Mg-chelatase subunit ChlI